MANPRTEVLVLVDGREIGRHAVSPGVYSLGASSQCDIRIDAKQVSPLHARLTIGDRGSLFLELLDSDSGAFLDDQTIAAATTILPCQIVQLGTAQIMILENAADGSADSTVGTEGCRPPAAPPSARYETGAQIAKGGMGAIFSARQPAIRREVALKVLLREPGVHERLRFIEEAQITGQLEHPNIVPVHDLAFNEKGQPYYTMKLVKGSTLREILKLLSHGDSSTIAKYSLAALLTIFQKVCDAMAFAHAKGVIHRDLKPANIMVGEFGEVLVMDWGLAKVVRRGGASRAADVAISSDRDEQRDSFATLTGVVMGTPQYMSPEQSRGEIGRLDRRSDVFSLGAILYELVTLSPPFSGKTTQDILANIRGGRFISPTARLREPGAPHPSHLPGGAIPDSLEAVIMKALSLDRSERYQSVGLFQADLTAYQSGFAPAAENAGRWKHFRLLVGRHRSVSTAIAASFLLIAGITAAFTVKIMAERDRAETGEKTARSEAAVAEAAEKQYREQVRLASRSDGTKALTAGSDGAARIWEVAALFQETGPPPAWVLEWASAIAGWKFNGEGVMRPMPAKERIAVLYSKHEDADGWSRLARWVVTEHGKRTTHLDSPHTLREIAERERDFSRQESLESALHYDPTVPLVRLLLAAFEKEPQRAAFLRDYDLKRLPDDAILWARAVKALAQQHDTERAQLALKKLATLAPEKANGLQKELGL